MYSRKSELLVNIAYYGVIALGIYLLMRYLLPALLPFLIAFLISAALHRPTMILTDRFPKIPSKLFSFLVPLVFYAFLALSFSMIFRSLFMQLIEFLSSVPTALNELAGELVSSIENRLSYLPSWLRDTVGEADAGQYILSAAEALSAPLINLLGSAGSAAIKLPSAIFVIIVTVMATFFISADYEYARNLVLTLFPAKARKVIVHTKQRASQAFTHLLKTYGLLTLATFGELCLGFWLFNLLGAEIKYPIPLALVICLVDILPVLGVGTVLIPWAVISFFSGSRSLCVMLLILFGLMYIVRSILESRLLGHRYGLRPAVTLLALYVGGRWFGVLGILLFPLAMIVATLLWKDGILLRKSPEEKAAGEN